VINLPAMRHVSPMNSSSLGGCLPQTLSSFNSPVIATCTKINTTIGIQNRGELSETVIKMVKNRTLNKLTNTTIEKLETNIDSKNKTYDTPETTEFAVNLLNSIRIKDYAKFKEYFSQEKTINDRFRSNLIATTLANNEEIFEPFVSELKEREGRFRGYEHLRDLIFKISLSDRSNVIPTPPDYKVKLNIDANEVLSTIRKNFIEKNNAHYSYSYSTALYKCVMLHFLHKQGIPLENIYKLISDRVVRNYVEDDFLPLHIINIFPNFKFMPNSLLNKDIDIDIDIIKRRIESIKNIYPKSLYSPDEPEFSPAHLSIAIARTHIYGTGLSNEVVNNKFINLILGNIAYEINTFLRANIIDKITDDTLIRAMKLVIANGNASVLYNLITMLPYETKGRKIILALSPLEKNLCLYILSLKTVVDYTRDSCISKNNNFGSCIKDKKTIATSDIANLLLAYFGDTLTEDNADIFRKIASTNTNTELANRVITKVLNIKDDYSIERLIIDIDKHIRNSKTKKQEKYFTSLKNILEQNKNSDKYALIDKLIKFLDKNIERKKIEKKYEKSNTLEVESIISKASGKYSYNFVNNIAYRLLIHIWNNSRTKDIYSVLNNESNSFDNKQFNEFIEVILLSLINAKYTYVIEGIITNNLNPKTKKILNNKISEALANKTIDKEIIPRYIDGHLNIEDISLRSEENHFCKVVMEKYNKKKPILAEKALSAKDLVDKFIEDNNLNWPVAISFNDLSKDLKAKLVKELPVETGHFVHIDQLPDLYEKWAQDRDTEQFHPIRKVLDKNYESTIIKFPPIKHIISCLLTIIAAGPTSEADKSIYRFIKWHRRAIKKYIRENYNNDMVNFIRTELSNKNAHVDDSLLAYYLFYAKEFGLNRIYKYEYKNPKCILNGYTYKCINVEYEHDLDNNSISNAEQINNKLEIENSQNDINTDNTEKNSNEYHDKNKYSDRDDEDIYEENGGYTNEFKDSTSFSKLSIMSLIAASFSPLFFMSASKYNKKETINKKQQIDRSNR